MLRECLIGLSCISLATCTAVPLTTTVDKGQTYTPSELMRVDILMAPTADIPVLCHNKVAIACTIWENRHSIAIYVDKDYYNIKHALQHELNHVVYGPKHTEEQ